MFLQKLDPDWKAAKIHGRASRIGRNPTTQSLQSGAICRCCLNMVQKQRVPICQNTKELQFCGFGVPLYFSFFRSCITMLILSVLSYHIISLYWAITDNIEYCEYLQTHSSARLLAQTSHDAEPKCWTFMVRFARLQKKVTVQEQIMRISAWVIQLLFLIYTRNQIIKTAKYFDERKTSLSDFAVLVKNIPAQKNLKKKFKQFFKTFFDEEYEVMKCTLLNKSEEIKSISEQIKQKNQKLRKFYQEENFDEDFDALNKEVQQLRKQLYQAALKIKKAEENDDIECEKAILIFNSDQIKQNVLAHFQQKKRQKKKLIQEIFGKHSCMMVVEEAPQPEQIIWDNIHVFQKSRIKRIIISYATSIFILAVLTVIIYYILHGKTKLIIQSLTSEKDQEIKQQEINGAVAIVFITIILLLIFNKTILVTLFHKLTDFQRNQTGYKFQRSFGLKYCFGLFFTTAIMTLIVQGIQSQNFHTYLYGLIDQETLMFFSTTTFIPLFWLVNPVQVYKKFKRYRNRGRRDMTQNEANNLMEDSAYDIGKRYAEIIEIVWFTLLYETLIPFGGLLALIGLNIYYWVDKFNLLRRSVIKVNLSYKLPLYFLTILQWSIVMQPVGALIFDGLLRQLQPFNLATSIVMIVLGLVYIFLPKNKLIYYFHYEKFNLQQTTYKQAKKYFTCTYNSCHPIIKILNERKYYQRKKTNLSSRQNFKNDSSKELLGYESGLAS